MAKPCTEGGGVGSRRHSFIGRVGSDQAVSADRARACANFVCVSARKTSGPAREMRFGKLLGIIEPGEAFPMVQHFVEANAGGKEALVVSRSRAVEKIGTIGSLPSSMSVRRVRESFALVASG